MITQKTIINLRHQILSDDKFHASYTEAIEWAKNYELMKDRFSVADHFRMLIFKNKWGRQAGYAFLSFIREDYKILDLLSDGLQHELNEIETRILGQCVPENIIRFHNDPAHIDELTDYVRAESWLNELYYQSGVKNE